MALLKDAAPTTKLIDLKGCSVLPGFFGAHPHADREGLKARGGIPIAGLHSVADIVEVVRRAAQTTPAGEWIVLMPMGEPLQNISVARPISTATGSRMRGTRFARMGGTGLAYVVTGNSPPALSKLVAPKFREMTWPTF